MRSYNPDIDSAEDDFRFGSPRSTLDCVLLDAPDPLWDDDTPSLDFEHMRLFG